VPLSNAAATSNILAWDDTSVITAVAIVDPTPTANTVYVRVWDESGNVIGASTVSLPPYHKTAASLRSLPGLSGIAGKRGAAQFYVGSGSVAVLGLRFDRLAFTSIPTANLEAAATGALVTEREVTQTGLAIGLASTVLQSQVQILGVLLGNTVSCMPLDGGGSLQANGNVVTVYYDSGCSKRYIVTGPNTTASDNNNHVVASETATYYGPDGSTLGALTLNETIAQTGSGVTAYGLGVFTPAKGAQTPVQLGVYCGLSSGTLPCAGGIAQDFPELGIAIGAVTPLNVQLTGSTDTAPVNFTGGGSAVTGTLGSLTLTNPSPTSLVIQGGTPYATTTVQGGAGTFELFPPTPTSWTLTDAGHDEQVKISLISDANRSLTITVIAISTGATLATGMIDQSGSGSITWSDGTVSAIANWTLAD